MPCLHPSISMGLTLDQACHRKTTVWTIVTEVHQSARLETSVHRLFRGKACMTKETSKANRGSDQAAEFPGAEDSCPCITTGFLKRSVSTKQQGCDLPVRCRAPQPTTSDFWLHATARRSGPRRTQDAKWRGRTAVGTPKRSLIG